MKQFLVLEVYSELVGYHAVEQKEPYKIVNENELEKTLDKMEWDYEVYEILQNGDLKQKKF